MGCASSKGVGVKSSTKDIYSPLPSSFALFDINSIKEPWLSIDNTSQANYEKSSHLPATIIQKLNTFEADVPHSWDEVSKALEDLKPSLHGEKEHNIKAAKPVISAVVPGGTKQIIRRSSFHTVEQLDAKLSMKQEKDIRPRKSESFKTEVKKPEIEKREPVATESNGPIIKPVKDNPFILRDRMEREKEGKLANYDKLMKMKRDPLSDFQEKCPPGGANSVVLYTTSLRGVRKTYEDCNTLRELLEGQRVVVDERDVSLHGKFLTELKDIVGEGVSVPRLFVKGRYIGGVVEVTELNESGRFGRLLSWAGVERGVGRQACKGCGGARFVPCVACGGSCKVLVDGVKERCEYCNENGLALCPACH